ncbi:hypothetical protein LshimejAT787_1801570 [Lyophyllum shimeji]|uniref:Uncharacterized protein n=1 Tax=Lyophyllum shimeji TaxID=47721 RepID=A0A9P3PXG4_LYOSH|nr:hypothetical protein LshimejAT787_1801570 [Lyophyllum shimeji]
MTTTAGMYIHFDPNKIDLPPVLRGPVPLNQRGTPLACTGPSSSGTKRKRDTSSTPGPRSNNFEKVLQRATQNAENHAAKPAHDGMVTKDRVKSFDNKDQLLQALRDCFRESHDVNFAASYRTYDPRVSHKQRIQTVNHEIWKATGYRFTVKDHPRTKDGHKTRLWCSQDEAHKNKPCKFSRAPRTSSDGATVAKARYPCRSGLLICSRDDKTQPGFVAVVIRIHHHFAHEAYYDHTLPPEMTRSIWEKMAMGSFPPPPLPPPPQPILAPSPQFPAQQVPTEIVARDDSSEQDWDHEDECVSDDSQDPDGAIPNLDPALRPPLPPPPPSAPPSLNSEEYRARMRQHIANIREFCDGLDYQLQFNDVRLLEVLESDGAQFLKLVHRCLEIEGRLKAIPADSTNGAASHSLQTPVVDEEPAMAS